MIKMTQEKLYDSYPDPLASNELKMSERYGLTYAKFIELEWFYGDENSRYIKNKTRFQRLEDLRRNEPNIQKFKDILGINQDKAWTAIDWQFFPIVPKFIDLITDMFPIEIFDIKANGIDELSTKERSNYRNNLEEDMLSMPFTNAFSEGVGKDFNPVGFVPESYEALDLHMELEYRQPREIAIEVATNKILEMNGWDELFNRIIQDLVVFGTAWTKNEIDSSVGIAQRYVNPKHFIYSYDHHHSRDKRGVYYFGEVKIYTVEEVQKRSGNKFTADELKAMASNFAGRYSNEREFDENHYMQYNVEVLEYCFKTTLSETYKKDRNGNLHEKKEDWEPTERTSKLSGDYDVWFEGSYITGTDLVYGYGLMSDMVRPQSDINKVLPPYTGYEINTISMVERMESIADNIQITRLKLQHLIATAKPKGIIIDIDALEEVDLGTGDLLTPADVIDIYNQKGDLIYSGRALDGSYQNIPIKEIPNGIGSDLQQLVNYYNYNIQLLYHVTGVNPVTDGTAPVTDTLVGVQQNAISATNTSLKHILNGAISILKNTTEVIVSRIQQMKMYGHGLNKAIMDAVGETHVKSLQDSPNDGMENLHLYLFGITIEIAPDNQEVSDFRRTLDTAVQAQSIDITDRIDLLNIKNIKLANKLLKIRIERRKRHMDKMEERRIQTAEQAKASAAIQIERERQKTLQMEIMAAREKTKFEAQTKMLTIGKQGEIDGMLLRLRYMLEGAIADKNNAYLVNRDQMKEDAKDMRTSKQATQQSELINQRNGRSRPIDFEQRDRLKQLFPGEGNQQQEIPEVQTEKKLQQGIPPESLQNNI